MRSFVYRPQIGLFNNFMNLMISIQSIFYTPKWLKFSGTVESLTKDEIVIVDNDKTARIYYNNNPANIRLDIYVRVGGGAKKIEDI